MVLVVSPSSREWWWTGGGWLFCCLQCREQWWWTVGEVVTCPYRQQWVRHISCPRWNWHTDTDAYTHINRQTDTDNRHRQQTYSCTGLWSEILICMLRTLWRTGLEWQVIFCSNIGLLLWSQSQQLAANVFFGWDFIIFLYCSKDNFSCVSFLPLQRNHSQSTKVNSTDFETRVNQY